MIVFISMILVQQILRYFTLKWSYKIISWRAQLSSRELFAKRTIDRGWNNLLKYSWIIILKILIGLKDFYLKISLVKALPTYNGLPVTVQPVTGYLSRSYLSRPFCRQAHIMAIYTNRPGHRAWFFSLAPSRWSIDLIFSGEVHISKWSKLGYFVFSKNELSWNSWFH